MDEQNLPANNHLPQEKMESCGKMEFPKREQLAHHATGKIVALVESCMDAYKI